MQKAMVILQEISKKNQYVDDSRTITAFTAFEDFSLNIRFIYYIKKGSDIFSVMTQINMETLKQFNDNKLNFAFPTQTLYTVNENR